ncbi:MAG: pyridoxal-phosphate dependent enzyme [Thermoplasmatales archaeon]
MLKAVCSRCGKERAAFSNKPTCDCGGVLVPIIEFKYREGSYLANYPYLEKIVELGEQETPLLEAGSVKFKLDYFQPTFSYKDRGSKSLISSLSSILPNGTELNEDSSGNAGASISAYGRASGFKVNIFVPENTKQGKVNQIKAYGANIHLVKGTRKDVEVAASTHPGYYASHVLNPEFRDGMRQLSYEIFRQLHHKSPARVFVPVSAGTLLLGLVSGFEHLADSGEISRIPEIVGVQTDAVCPVCAAVNDFPYDKDNGKASSADALVSREPVLKELMVRQLKKYGKCITVTEEEIINARSELSLKGIYVEYSSATVWAAYKKGHFDGESVLVLTGNGLKTP